MGRRRFNSATAVNRGEPARSGPRPANQISFNSATAVNRGEPCGSLPIRLKPRARQLQFGHGGEPWRTVLLGGRKRAVIQASIRPRR